MIDKLSSFVVFDTETTGLNPYENEIIEIGAVKYKNGKKVDEYSVFIKPKNKVPDFIKNLTHITDEQLNNGLDIKTALNGFIEFIEDELLICHNTNFDIGFINSWLDKLNMVPVTNMLTDTLALGRCFLPFVKNHRLQSLCGFFNVNLTNAHRAIYDAMATAEVFVKLIDYAVEYFSLDLCNTLYQVANKGNLTYLYPVLEDIVNYKRKTILVKPDKTKKVDVAVNYIEHTANTHTSFATEEAFKQNGYIAKCFDSYELRQGQLDMSMAISSAFVNQQFIEVEAGTGVGKSLAYLVPAIKFANESNERVIISTNTKNLQEQLFYKDLPLLKKALPMGFKALLLKGRDNYLCKSKWKNILFDIDDLSEYEAKEYINIVVWENFTATGDITENTSFNRNKSGGFWKKLASERHFCRGKRCPLNSKCYMARTRKLSEESNIVIVNHSLLLADILTSNASIGAYKHLIIDEAHNLPNIAASHLGISLSFLDINSMLNHLWSRGKTFGAGILNKLKADTVKSLASKTKLQVITSNCDRVIDIIKNKKDVLENVFKLVEEKVKDEGSYFKLRVKQNNEIPNFLDEAKQILSDIANTIADVATVLSGIDSNVFTNYDEHLTAIEGALEKVQEFSSQLVLLQEPDFINNAYWLSTIDLNTNAIAKGVVNYAPLEVNEILNEQLYKNCESIVFTSATMAIRGSFKYFNNKMGLNLLQERKLQSVIVPSPFNYKKQALVIAPPFLPQPNDAYFTNQAARLILNAVEVSKAGTMVLFTSYRVLDEFYTWLEPELKSRNISLFAQGKGMSRTAMVQAFKEEKTAVLLGTSSFWEGVDIQGEALSLLILVKIPFQVPSEPIVEAYLEKLETDGKNSFMHFMVPNALLKYRQGFGRLIRSKKDKGAVIMLDSRVATKKYGVYFQQTLPVKTYFPRTPIEITDLLANWFKPN